MVLMGEHTLSDTSGARQ